MAKVILINGQYRSGKDYTAELVENELLYRGYKVERMSFATPLKEIIARTFDISLKELDDYKNNTDEYGLEIKVYPNNQPQCTIKYIDFRTILQRFGTEGMKPEFGNDVWSSNLYRKAENAETDFIIVTDFRFVVEYNESATTLKIKNDDVINEDRHASERELDNFDFDYMINNTGKPDLTSQIRKYCDYLEDLKLNDIKHTKYKEM